MPMPRIPMSGRYGRLVILSKSGLKWDCLCDCGNRTLASASALLSGRKKSCGCLRRDGENSARRQHRYRGICACGDHVFADLTQGYVGLLSPQDAKWFQERSWCVVKFPDGYIGMKAWGSIKLHRRILGLTDPKRVVDHINGNSFDNRRSNLRVCSSGENIRNQRPHRRKLHSQFKGVTWDTKNKPNPWVVRIQVGRKRKTLGNFASAEEAARAYDKAAREMHGRFALTNKDLGLLPPE